MSKKSCFICFLTFQGVCLPLSAQFYTITADTVSSQRIQPVEDSIPDDEDGKTVMEDGLFSTGRGIEVSIERDIPVFVNVNDSMMSELLQDRLTVCLPLDFLKMSSRYGYRTDPIIQCERFHDGIDLRCSYSRVYAMLPAKVKEVHHGNKGYGNYVILDHGRMECLYGHLSTILVNEGDIISAGTVVALSGNTGKSTAPHLHIRFRKEGKSVDPQPFIGYLNDYITRLQDKISYLMFGKAPTLELNIGNLAKVIEQNGLSHPCIVIAQALLETGYFTSRLCLECNNLFGLRRKDGSYYQFDNWEESVKAYKNYVQYKYKGGSYLIFLKAVGYAEDPDYVVKVAQIARTQ